MNKRSVILFLLVISIILCGYWFKNQMDINFFELLSIRNFLPFKFLIKNDVITLDKYSVLLNANFNSNNIRVKWLKLYLKEKGDITQGYDSNGINNSRCLLIKSNCNKSWAY